MDRETHDDRLERTNRMWEQEERFMRTMTTAEPEVVCPCCGQPDGTCPSCGREHEPAMPGRTCELCCPELEEADDGD